MNASLSIIANLLTSAEGKDRLNEAHIKFFVRLLDEMAANEIYEDETDSEVLISIISRTIRALANAASSNEANRALIQSISGKVTFVLFYALCKVLN